MREENVKEVVNKLLEEKKEIEEILKKTRMRLENAPKGHIRVLRKGNRAEFYYTGEDDKESKNGKYVKRENLSLVKVIIQRDYDKHILDKGNKRIQIISKFLKGYKETDLKYVYEKTNPCRRALLTYPIISDEEYARLWQQVEYEGKEFADNSTMYVTEKGERVRSKSEKIIADKLYMLGIPYRYECPLLLEERIKIYPDFTLLKIDTREEIYLEHLGLMDDEKYVENTIRKLNTYERNGVFLGVNLLLTYENGKMPLNTRNLDSMLRRFFNL